MELREKSSLIKKISEYSIRFRLIEMFLAVALCTVALFCIDGVLVSIQPLSDKASAIIADFTHGDFQVLTTNPEVAFAILVLFLFRWKYFGFKCGLLWFFFLLFNAMFLLAVSEYKDMMQVLVAAVFFVAITSFFFVRSIFVKLIFPFIFLAYTFSAWLLLLGVSSLVWFGLISVFLADIFHFAFGIKYHISEDAKKKKTLEGAIAHGTLKTIPVSLLTVILIIAMDIVFYCMNLPMLVSGSLPQSIVISLSYALWMPFFTAAMLSFCPLENTCEKIQQKSR
ncbi:MAG: hypothetical protein LBH25_07015 [Fibromonadaceae bacterium]|jgi:hypothetical protein|nr:hypothetical protein [Fibromonadaceae bacterium]